ncbi:hypothetical protein M9H77_32262 [Catharanthus roseus]|uniref:Uncharacterized protein n=1 Tax=Catharanthus roseus TaxID=4058 RepID=A0ACC0A2D8_CATRO|nr:hypothetical protein M9H77_32262 [Catharanthus roseus]
MSMLSVAAAEYPLGLIMAKFMPRRRVYLKTIRMEFSLNPGPFDVREFVLISIFANAGAAYGDLLLSSSNLPSTMMSTSKTTTFKSLSKKGSKASASELGSYSHLDVKIIRPQDNLVLGGWFYAIGGFSILFLDVNEAESMNRMKKYYLASGMLHCYKPRDKEHICETTAVNHHSEIRYGQLGAIRKEFAIPDDFQVRAPDVEERAHVPPKWWMSVYQDLLKAGLRLPLYNIFLDVTSYWGIGVGKLAPNGVRVIIAFILMRKAFRVPTSLELFSRFFFISNRL